MLNPAHGAAMLQSSSDANVAAASTERSASAQTAQPTALAHIANPQVSGLRRQTQTWMGLAFVALLCGVSFFFGLIGLILCHSAQQAAEHGKLQDAQAKLRLSKTVTLSGFAVLATVLVGYSASLFIR
jgi:uncharacterized Tic20 family protein